MSPEVRISDILNLNLNANVALSHNRKHNGAADRVRCSMVEVGGGWDDENRAHDNVSKIDTT
jgi:uncharacterized protein (DUF736 family)